MAVNITRINNNQITDAVDGNSQYGINANTKIQPNSITSTLLANNLTYGSDLTITGNLSVTGNVTAIDTTNVTIEDPLITLATTQTGTPAVDIGFIGQRGVENNVAFVWNEANTTFAAVYTDSGSSDNTIVNILSYADIKVANANITGTLYAANLSFTGNVAGNLDVVGYVNAGNVTTTGFISAVGNVAGNYFIGNGSQLTGITTDAIYNGNSSANINTAGGNLDITINAVPTAIFYQSGLSVIGNIDTANAINTGTLSSIGNITTSGNISAVGNVTSRDVNATGNVSVSGNVVSDNNIIGANFSTLGNVYSNYVITPGTTINGGVSTTGNIVTNQTFVGNTLSGNTLTLLSDAAGINLSSTGNINVNDSYINNLLDPVQAQDAATKQYVDTVAAGLDLKQSCLVGTTTELDSISGVTNVVYDNGVAGVGATLTITTSSQLFIDGINVTTLGTGSSARILIKNEATIPTATSDAAWNGIYYITSTVAGAGTTVLTRSVDFDDEGSLGSMPGAFTFLQQGTDQTATGWVCINSNPITVGTTPIMWAQFSGAQNYTAGNAIAINGTVITTLFDGTTVGVNGSNQLYIPANAPLVSPNIGMATGTSLSVTGNVHASSIFASAELSASGNIFAGADISAVGNVNVTDVNALGNVSAQGNVIADVFTGTTVSITGNLYSIYASVNGNVDADNVNVTGNVYVAGNPIGYAAGSDNQIQFNEGNNFTADANLTYDPIAGMFATGNISVSGNITVADTLFPDPDQGANIGAGDLAFSNIYTYGISGENTPGGLLTVNPNQQPNDFAVSTSNNTGLLYVSDTGNSVSIGSDIQTTGATLAINATDSMLVPGGNIAQRPATGVAGMFRWNSSYSYLEVFDGTTWNPVGFQQFTVIQNEQFTGDGVTVDFTLGSSQTTDSCIVTINGILQAPTTAYSVSGVYPTCVLTFTEAPLVDDTIEVRELTTTTTIASISNASGNAVVSADATAANVNITGNLVVGTGGYLYGNGAYLTGISGGGNANVDFTSVNSNIIPSANAVYSLGNATNEWAELYVSNNSIIIGGVTLSNNGNILTFAGNALVSETPAGAISVTGNIIGSNIFTNGYISATGNIIGTNIKTTGNVSATGNVIADYFIGDGSALSNINGGNVTGVVDNATNAVNATVATVVSGSAQGNITSVGTLVQLSSTGNVTAANFRTTGLVTATGNVYGNFFIGDGSQLTGVTASGVAAGALTGNTLSPNVTFSTLTSVGTLTDLSVAGNIDTPTVNATLVSAIDISVTGNIVSANFVGNGSQLTDIQTSIIANGASNVSVATSNGNIVMGVGGNADVVVIADHGISTTGNISTPTIFFSNNLIGSSGNLVIDPLNDGTTGGNVIIQGNLNVLGTTTTINSNTVSIDSLVYIAANNAATASVANGAGLQIANANYASLTFNSITNEWNTSIGLSVNGNVSAANLNLSGYITSSNGLQATNTYPGEFVDGVVVDYTDGNARISTGSADGIQFFNEGIGNTLLASITSLGDVSAIGKIIGSNILTTNAVSAAGNVSGSNINGTLHGIVATPTQTSITSVGTLSSLSVAGAIGALSIVVTTATANVHNGTTVSVTGTVTAASLVGTVATAAQTSITSVGVLTSLSSTGQVKAASLAGDGGNIGNIQGANVNGNVTTAINVAGNAQGNITSVGTLTNLNTSGNVSATGSVTTNNISVANGYTIADPGYAFGSTLKVGTNANSFGIAIQTANSVVSVNNNPDGSGYNSVDIGTPGGFWTFDDTGLLSAPGGISAVGNIQGNYIVGNGSHLTSLTGANVTGSVPNATLAATANIANIAYSVAGANVTGTVANATLAATANIADIAYSVAGANVTGTVANATLAATATVANSVAGANVVGAVTSALNVTGNAQANITSVGILSSLSVTGDVAGGNLLAASDLSVGGAMQGGSLSISANGNITAGNISIAGNVTAAFHIGNGSLLTSLTGANVTGTVANATYATSAGSATTATSATTAGTVTNAAQGNITSVGTLTSLSVSGAVQTGDHTSSNYYTAGVVSATGNITGANHIAISGVYTPSIVNSGTSAVGNIGSSAVPFNTIFAQATSAQYADLAEKYLADAEYAPGTVVVFGGTAEVTVSPEDSDRRVAGVVSTNPSYIMNGGLEGENVATVALTGRVPCRVRGKVRKGDLMVSAGYGAARAELDPKVGTVIGKALENFDGEEGIIEVVVGRV